MSEFVPGYLPEHSLMLPYRTAKGPSGSRETGATMVIDSGLAYGEFTDMVDSHGAFIDVVKLGFGTSYINPELTVRKAAYLDEYKLPFYFGGTLFERFVAEDKLEDYIAYCHRFNARYVEVSDGTITLSPDGRKAAIARLAAAGFIVFTEVGHKAANRQDELHAEDWVQSVQADIISGAEKVILEARESGKFGIANADGQLRQDIVNALEAASIPQSSIMYEAPTKELQVPLIQQFGANVNLGNIAPKDILSVETLRVGLRSDTFPENIAASVES